MVAYWMKKKKTVRNLFLEQRDNFRCLQHSACHHTLQKLITLLEICFINYYTCAKCRNFSLCVYHMYLKSHFPLKIGMFPCFQRGCVLQKESPQLVCVPGVVNPLAKACNRIFSWSWSNISIVRVTFFSVRGQNRVQKQLLRFYSLKIRFSSTIYTFGLETLGPRSPLFNINRFPSLCVWEEGAVWPLVFS